MVVFFLNTNVELCCRWRISVSVWCAWWLPALGGPSTSSPPAEDSTGSGWPWRTPRQGSMPTSVKKTGSVNSSANKNKITIKWVIRNPLILPNYYPNSISIMRPFIIYFLHLHNHLIWKFSNTCNIYCYLRGCLSSWLGFLLSIHKIYFPISPY